MMDMTRYATVNEYGSTHIAKLHAYIQKLPEGHYIKFLDTDKNWLKFEVGYRTFIVRYFVSQKDFYALFSVYEIMDFPTGMNVINLEKQDLDFRVDNFGASFLESKEKEVPFVGISVDATYMRGFPSDFLNHLVNGLTSF